jgi:hypothetical protein
MILRNGEITAKSVSIDGRNVTLVLASGKEVSLPVSKFPRLAMATPAQLAEVTLRRGGEALRWDNLDEDIQVASVVLGRWPGRGGSRSGAGRKLGNNRPVTARIGQDELRKLAREALREKISKSCIFKDAINIREAVASIATANVHKNGVTFDFSAYRSLASLRRHGYGGFRIQLVKDKILGTAKKVSGAPLIVTSAAKSYKPVAHLSAGQKTTKSPTRHLV